MKIECKTHEWFYEKDEGCMYCDDPENRETPVCKPNPFAGQSDEDIDELLDQWFGGSLSVYNQD